MGHIVRLGDNMTRAREKAIKRYLKKNKVTQCPDKGSMHIERVATDNPYEGIRNIAGTRKLVMNIKWRK